MIRANGVKKAFGEKVVLHGIDAEFQSGQVNFIIGRSGSGKSVLTKCMVGLWTCSIWRFCFFRVESKGQGSRSA